MIRALALTTGLALTLSLTACGGDDCESLQDEIQEIGRNIQQDPKLAMDEDTQNELAELTEKFKDKGCLP